MGRIMSESSTPLPFSNFTVDAKATATTPAAPNNLTSLQYAEAARKSNFNPTLAVVVSAITISFFVVGFASGYLRRWIWGAEALEREAILRRRLNPLRPPRQTLKPQRGLDPEIVAALPLVRYKDLPADEQAGKYFDCPVCLAVFDATDSLRLLPQCSHAFHSDCIDEWFRSHTTCPLCRVCLAYPVGKSVRREDPDGRVAEDDVERGRIRVPADFDVVDVVIGTGATAISGYESQADIPTVGTPAANTSVGGGEQEEQDVQVNARPVICSNAGGYLSFIPAIRVDIAPAKAALASIRRSSSVGTDLQLRHAGYVVDSEGTQHHRNFQFHAIAISDQDGNSSSTSRPVSLGDCWGGGAFSVAPGISISSKVGLQSVWSTRRSSSNLRQIAPV